MQKMLIVAFDARVGEVVAVEEIDSVNHGEYFVVVWTQGTHLLFKPRMVGEGFAELISIQPMRLVRLWLLLVHSSNWNLLKIIRGALRRGAPLLCFSIFFLPLRCLLMNAYN